MLKCTGAKIMSFFELHPNIVNFSILGTDNLKLSFCALSNFTEMTNIWHCDIWHFGINEKNT